VKKGSNYSASPKVKKVKKTAVNKKKLNLKSQIANRYKNGKISDEYPVFGLAWNHCFGLPKNLAAFSSLLGTKIPVDC